MAEHIGLDGSMKETAVPIRSGGRRIWRGKCPSDPKLIAQLVRQRAPGAERIGFKRAAVAIARKLAIIMDTMLKSGELFDPAPGASA